MLNFFTLDAGAGVVVAERTTKAEKGSNYSIFMLDFVENTPQVMAFTKSKGKAVVPLTLLQSRAHIVCDA